MNTDVIIDHHEAWIKVGSLGPMNVEKENKPDPHHNIVVTCRARHDDQQSFLKFEPLGGLVFTADNFTADGYISYSILSVNGRVDPTAKLPEVSCVTTLVPIAGPPAIEGGEESYNQDGMERVDKSKGDFFDQFLLESSLGSDNSNNTTSVLSGYDGYTLNFSQFAFLLLLLPLCINWAYYYICKKTNTVPKNSGERKNSSKTAASDRGKKGGKGGPNKKRSRKRMGRRQCATTADDMKQDNIDCPSSKSSEGRDKITITSNEEGNQKTNILNVSLDSTSSTDMSNDKNCDYDEITKPDEKQCKRDAIKHTKQIASIAPQSETEKRREQADKENAALGTSAFDSVKEKTNANEDARTGSKAGKIDSRKLDRDKLAVVNPEVGGENKANAEGCNSLSGAQATSSVLNSRSTSITKVEEEVRPITKLVSNNSYQNSIVLFIQGMTCGGCVKVVNRALNSFDDVESTFTDLKSCTSTVYFSAPRLNLLPMLVALDDLGMETFFEAQKTKATTAAAVTKENDRPSSKPRLSSANEININKHIQNNVGVIGQPHASNPLPLMDELRKGTITMLRRYQCSCACEGCICSDRPVQQDDNGVDVTLTDICKRLQDTLGTTNLEANFREDGGDKELRDKLSKTTFPCDCSNN